MRFILPLFLLLLATDARAARFDPAALVAAGEKQVGVTLRYDGTYKSIPYPGGDVPQETGVCTDVVIRAYRALGFDLQKLVHEDMKRNFSRYPKMWGLSKPDRNIDHRRVPNLQVFFARHGTSMPVSDNPADYKAGDIVTWDLTWPRRALPHIGIVTDKMSADGKRPLVVHNIGAGAQVEDMLFDYKITGHYRYAPDSQVP